jgi:hypothetical protein
MQRHFEYYAFDMTKRGRDVMSLPRSEMVFTGEE